MDISNLLAKVYELLTVYGLKVVAATYGILPMSEVGRWVCQYYFNAQCQTPFSICNPESAKVLEHRLDFAELGFDLYQT